MQPNESLYDQKPEEPVIPVASSTNSTPSAVSPLTSRFEYVDTTDTNSSVPHVIGHVSAPKSSSFFADFGMDSSFPKRTSSNSSKVQVSCA